jgi:hypothetical protein
MTAQAAQALPELSLRAGAPARASGPPWAFPVILACLLVEFVRPQDLVPALALLRPGLLLSGLLVLLLMMNSERLPLRNPSVLAFGALLAFMALWVPLATNNRWALNTFLTLLQWGLFALAAAAVVDTPARLRTLLMVWVVSAGVQGIWALTHAGRGISAFFGDENDVSLLLNMLLPFALAAGRTGRSGLRRALSFGLAVVLVCGVAATRSRGGFLGLVAASGAIVMFSRHRVRLLIVGAIAALVFAASIPAEYRSELQTISDDADGSRRDYFRMWGTARQVFFANPLFGVGQGNIGWVFAQYESYNSVTERSFAGRPVHSAYWTLLPELGLIGVGLYLTLLVRMVRVGFAVSLRAPGLRPSPLDPWGRALLQSLAPYLVSSLFISTLYYPQFYYLVALALVLERQQGLLARRQRAAARALEARAAAGAAA